MQFINRPINALDNRWFFYLDDRLKMIPGQQTTVEHSADILYLIVKGLVIIIGPSLYS